VGNVLGSHRNGLPHGLALTMIAHFSEHLAKISLDLRAAPD
jgi:hypothetical protein